MNQQLQRWITCLLVFGVLLRSGAARGREVFTAGRRLRSERSLVVSSTAGALRSVSAGGTQAQLDATRAALQAGDADSSSDGSLASRPSRCPGRCTEFGTCNEELARCDCPIGRNGTDCSEEVPSGPALQQVCARYGHTLASCTRVDAAGCVNGCNGRGRCVGGFCHCRPGFFGADCSLSLSLSRAVPAAAAGADDSSSSSSSSTAARPAVELLAGQGYAVRASGPRIYVYELPPELNVYGNLDRLDRPLMYMVWQRLLSAGVRVADPAAADFFFVPVRVRLSYDSEKLVQAVSYIRSTWPHWDGQPGGGGERHIFVHTGDWGRDELSEEAQALTRNATWLTHWGLARDHEFAGWKAAHRPGRDIVVPLVLQASLLSSYRLTRTTPLHPGAAAGGRKLRPRSRTMFFAGRVCGSRAQPSTNGTYPNCPDVLGKEDAYSAATRQMAFYHHHNRTGWKMVTSSKTYALDMLGSKFCLAPSGGWHGAWRGVAGKRAVISVLMGCVPVTVTDGLLQPFEPELRWDRFAIDVRERDIPVMHAVLEGLKADQVSEFQSNLRCAAQHLFWSSLFGSVFGEDGRYDAFETLMQVLRMRATYPSLGPEEYAYVDASFAAFMKCEAHLPGAGAATAAAAGAGAAGSGSSRSRGSGVAAVAAAGGLLGGFNGTGAAGGLLDVAKPDLGQALAAQRATAAGGGSSSSSTDGAAASGAAAAGGGAAGAAGGGLLPAPRALLLPAELVGEGGQGVTRQELCTHSELPVPPGSGSLPAAGSCNRCPRRRGRLLNPGGTICCNTKDLAKCPRLWD
ncbi:hypothetical protein HYH02_002701 [Chlamydomonas schloesseri]|uniref:EGF-like domain-containing protein n=1 Tax=Chlamydomonas schloesseri TaxID=2026947 RepID=A0A835WQY2_9CHLO|nr:hypothetical protein HYH02_002701 [Chlamydomonas schloesseri]|eukprot:KAG2452459.1 hypothetical protein HYH02_002701 [Chlamydomonas schloesseri]